MTAVIHKDIFKMADSVSNIMKHNWGKLDLKMYSKLVFQHCKTAIYATLVGNLTPSGNQLQENSGIYVTDVTGPACTCLRLVFILWQTAFHKITKNRPKKDDQSMSVMRNSDVVLNKFSWDKQTIICQFPFQ